MQNTYHNGLWNGRPAQYRVVNIIVGDEPEELKEHFAKTMRGEKRYLWFVPFIGKIREVVEVTAENQTFYLDNADGQGLHKVQTGGSPRQGHRSIYPSSVSDEIPREQWSEYDESKTKQIMQEVHDYWMSIDAEGYKENLKRVELLKQGLKALHQKYPKAFRR